MATVVTMPKLGFDMAEGTLVRWVRGIGETVQKGEVLAEIETDKATVEVEAVESGVVRKHLVQEGVAVPIGTPIAVIGTADEPIDDVAVPTPAASEPAVAPERAPSAPASPRPVEAAGALPSGLRASPLARRMASEAAGRGFAFLDLLSHARCLPSRKSVRGRSVSRTQKELG